MVVVRVHIDVQGSGPDLVLIHGWAMHGGVFAPLVERLAPRFRVHRVDLPGHGYSRDDDTFDLATCAAQIATATPPALWVGWSLGGLVALRAAIDQSASVRGMALLASSPCFVNTPDWPHGVDADVFTAFAANLDAHYREAIERFLALETMGSPNAQSELRELKREVFARGEPGLSALTAGLDALEHTDLRADLPALAMPSLWIAGRRDRLVPPAAMQWAAEHAPRGRYLEINSGHAPFVSHADEVADALARFAAERTP